MRVVNDRILLDMVDLDHILDIEALEGNEDIPPSEIFLEGLKNEMEFCGIDSKFIGESKVIELVLRLKY